MASQARAALALLALGAASCCGAVRPAQRPELDRDGDGRVGDADRCPDDPEDVDGFADEDGCADPDDDGDRIADVDDLCPRDPEDRDEFEDEDGCPDPDDDGDRMADAQDRCPREPEQYNGVDDEDGCPDNGDAHNPAVIVDYIQLIDHVYFAAGSSRVSRAQIPILDALAQTLQGNPQIGSVAVVGFSAAGERPAAALSLARARAVVTSLVERGVEPGRLVAYGAGQSAEPPAPDGNVYYRPEPRVGFAILRLEGEVIGRWNGTAVEPVAPSH